jgi:MFS family permease
MALASMSAAYVNTLFTQTVAYAADEFHASAGAQGIGAAVVRWGIIISLPIVALADSHGRRRMVLLCAWAGPIVSALGAFSTSFPMLIATQTVGRPLGITLDVLVVVVVLEEMPREDRAYAMGLLAILSGIGAGMAVVALPIADHGIRAWRIIYLITLMWILVAVVLTKSMPESRRFEAHRRRASTPVDAQRYRRALFHICSVAFLSNVFIATASIFQNRYLKDTRAYSALLVAVFTVATSSPAAIGLLAGGRIADKNGRRVVGALMVPVGAVLLAFSFATRSALMWSTAIVGAIAFGIAYPALAVYRGELFPTAKRGTAGGIVMTSSLIGGSIGLVLAGWLIDRGVSYGTVMLWFCLAPIAASVVVWRHYPETAHLELEEINPEDAPS